MSNILTAEDAARILKTDKKTVIALLQQGEITGKKVGRGWKVNANSVIAYQQQKNKRGRIYHSLRSDGMPRANHNWKPYWQENQ